MSMWAKKWVWGVIGLLFSWESLAAGRTGEFYVVPVFEFSDWAMNPNRQGVMGYQTVEIPLSAEDECKAVQEAEKEYLGKEYKGSLWAWRCIPQDCDYGDSYECRHFASQMKLCTKENSDVNPPHKKIVGIDVRQKDQAYKKVSVYVGNHGSSAGLRVCLLGAVKGVKGDLSKECPCKVQRKGWF